MRRAGIERCESPIEVKLAEAFSRTPGFSWRTDDAHEWEVGRWENGLYLLSQPVYGGIYRCDFGINPLPFPGEELPAFLLIVEADGHDYHERTKEQARRDRQRDRYMTSTGAIVLRFTGSEIHADADGCVWEVLGVAARLWQGALDAAFRRFVEETHQGGVCNHKVEP